MPNFGLGDTPIQISQVGTQEALIQNTGTVPVYLDAYSSVSSANHGLAIAPLSSVNWGAGRDLWAVCAPGQTSTLTVLYGATGTALSEVAAVVTGVVTVSGPVDATIVNASIPVTGSVNANVTNAVIPVNGSVNANITNATIPVSGSVSVSAGTVNANITNANVPVTGSVNANITNANIAATVTGNIIVDSGTVTVGGILTPVIVQGGGTILYDAAVNNVPAASFTTITIPAPSNGQTYYGIDVSWEVLNSGAGITASRLLVFADGFPGVATEATAVRDTSAAEVDVVGYPDQVAFTVPMRTTFPLTIRVRNSHATATLNGYLRVTGSAYALPYPVDTLQGWNGVGSLVASSNSLAANDYFTLPGSRSTTKYRMQASAAGLDNVQLRQWNTSTDAYDIILARLSHSPYYQQAGAAGQYDIQEFSLPPIGLPHQVFFAAAFANPVRVSLVEIGR